MNVFSVRINRYFRENWGALFITGSVLLFIALGFFLSVGLSSLANSLSVLAYDALNVGIALQLVCLFKYSNKSARSVYSMSDEVPEKNGAGK